MSSVGRIAVYSSLSASKNRTTVRQFRGPYWFIIDRVSSFDALPVPSHRACIALSDIPKVPLGGTKLSLSDLLLSVSRFSFRVSPLARALEGKGSGLTLIVDPTPNAQRPLAPGNVSRVVSRIFERRVGENLIKARNTPTVIFFLVVPWLDVL